MQSEGELILTCVCHGTYIGYIDSYKASTVIMVGIPLRTRHKGHMRGSVKITEGCTLSGFDAQLLL